jgi:hypothetical protein
MATFFYSFLSLQYNKEMSPSKLTPSIYPSLPLSPSSFPVSILYVAISERLLLLMGDVNHRCAHKTKKHVHSTSRASAKRKRRRAIKKGCYCYYCCCCLFQYTDAATHIYASRVMHVHLTLLSSSFSSLFCSYIRVISVWWYLSSTGDDEKRARRRCL